MKADGLLDEIKSRIDIVEFVSDYVHLKKSGQNFKGLCPFHTEKTPSFMVSQSKQIFHCFGCGAGGDVVSFLMKHDNLPFVEALRYLAEKAGIKSERFHFDKGLAAKREELLRINEEAMKFFVMNLKASKRATDYLQRRNVNKEFVELFRIGFAPDQRGALTAHLRKAGRADALIQKAGLVITDGSGFRDSFRKRIIFPILNLKNDVVAFGGRVMDNSLPKYINSPETEVFKKSETLFAANLAKDEIRKKGYAIIVEGYLDAIICHQYGFRNTVAPLGTALTPRHLRKLRPLTKKVILVFDSDSAGISAARRSLPILCENDFIAKVMLLPGGEDPDSFLRKGGALPFQKMIAGAYSMIDFLMNTSGGDKTSAVREALTIIAGIPDILRREEMLRELADKSRVGESALRSELDRLRKKAVPGSLKEGEPLKAPSPREEVLLLSALIAFPDKAAAALSRVETEDLRDTLVRSILHRMKTLGDRVTLASLLEGADDAERDLITRLSLDPGFDLEAVDQNISDCLQTITYRIYEEKKRLADAKEPDDAALHNSLLKEKRRFIKGANT